MADAPKGLNVHLAAYAVSGGTAADHFALGYAQAGRFGKATTGRTPEWSKAERDGYNAGMKARAEDNAGTFAE